MVSNLSVPGAFQVSNRGGRIALDWHVSVEQLRDGRWVSVYVIPDNLRLVGSCGTPPKAPCRILESGETLRPVPWTGFSCYSQCPWACRGNTYFGPGVFRFVVRDCGHELRFGGPPFYLGAEPTDLSHWPRAEGSLPVGVRRR